MTITQMHQAFKLKLDKTNSLEYPAFLPEEIDFWINEAIRMFVKSRTYGNNAKAEAFEQSQKRIDDLRTLVKKEWLNVVVGTNTTYTDDVVVYLADLTTTTYPYWFCMGEEVVIRYTDCMDVVIEKRTQITEGTIDKYPVDIQDPYCPLRLHFGEARPLRIFLGDNVEFTSDGNYEIIKYFLTYIKKPDEVSISTSTSTDLPEETHEEIVNIAVNLVLEDIESKRFQTQSFLLNKQE